MPEPERADAVRLHNAVLEGADFSGRNLTTFSVAESRLTRCRFNEVRAPVGSLGGGYRATYYVDCHFDGMKLKKVLPGRATFLACSFQDVHIGEFYAQNAEFVDCVFSGTLKKAIFSAVPLEYDERLGRKTNEYRGNDFSRAHFGDVSFRRGVDLGKQRLPVGPEYVYIGAADAAVARAEAAIESWSDEYSAKNVQIVLRVLKLEIARGQRDLFVTKAFLVGDLSPECAARLVHALNDAG